MCTAITYNAENFYFGRTLDYEFSYGEEVTITPKNFPFEFRFAGNIESHYAIIGMATIMKSDYYPLPEIFPWVSTIFVSEKYRGNRISGKLIEFANQYAKEIGFDKTYIPTEHIGLYEKYGYCYVKDIVNYGNGIDRLYVKKLY